MSDRLDTQRVAVIGGGIAGLAASATLVDAGAKVVVLEADRLGGKLQTTTFAGRPVEQGPDAFLARVPDATRFAHRVGLGDELVAPRTGSAFVCIDGLLEPLPVHQVLGIPTDPDDPELRRIIGDDGIAAVRADLDAPGAPPDEHDDPTIGSFIRSRLGDPATDRLVGPLVGGINAGDIDALSLAAVTPQIDHLARSADEPSLVRAAARARHGATSDAPVFLAPARGMTSLVEAAAETLEAAGAEIHAPVAVRSLERLADSWRVIADRPGLSGAATDLAFDVDAVLVATPAPVSAFLLQDHAPEAAVTLGSIAHASVAIATFSFDPAVISHPMDGSGFLVPREEGTLTTAASWLSSKWDRMSPDHGDGTLLIRVSAGRIDDRRIAELDDDELTTRLADELSRLLGISAPPVASRLTRWPSALPQYAPGHLGRIASIEADLARVSPPVTIAGSALRGVGIPAAIASGTRAADHLVEALALR